MKPKTLCKKVIIGVLMSGQNIPNLSVNQNCITDTKAQTQKKMSVYTLALVSRIYQDHC